MFQKLFSRFRTPALKRCPDYARIERAIEAARAKHMPVRHLQAEKSALIHRALRGQA